MRRVARSLAVGLACAAWACGRSPADPTSADPGPEEPVPEDPASEEPVPDGAPDTLTAMTFNIFGDGSRPEHRVGRWEERRDGVVEAVAAARAAVVGLQEAHLWQVEWLVERLAGYAHVARGRNTDGGGQTVAILFDTRALALEESGHFWLSPTPEEPGSTGGDAWGLAGVPRMVTWVRLSFVEGEGELYVYNTHLPANETGGARARRLATLLLAERIAKRARSDVPFLLLGDLNATEDEFPLRYLEREVPGCEGAGCPEPPAFSPVAVVDTWRAANSGTQGTRCGVSEDGTVVLHGARVDYVLAGDPTVGDPSAAPISAPEVLASAIALESDGCASDHVPVVSRIVLPHPRATSSASARDPRAVARGKGAPAR